MSWVKAIEKVCAQVTRCPPHHSSHVMSATVANRLVPAQSREGTRRQDASVTTEVMGMSTAALHRVSDTWDRALAVIQFSQTVRPSNLELQMRQFPFLPAVQCVGILVEAGQITKGIEVMRSWRHSAKGKKLTTRSKIRATARLKSTLRTLGVIRDVETLRIVVSVLHQSFMEQKQNKLQRRSHRNKFTSESSTLTTNEDGYPLLSALGVQRTQLLLVKAVHELVVQNEGVVPIYEKLSWINVVAEATTPHGFQVSALIPFSLQEDFKNLIETSSSYDEDLLQQLGEAFVTGFIHPLQCSPVEILSMPRSEIRRLYGRGIRPSGEIWAEVKDIVLPCSHLLQQGCHVATLIDVLCSPDTAFSSSCKNRKTLFHLTEEQQLLRQFFIKQLCSRQSFSRRLWSSALLRHPRLLRRLNISPLLVFRVSALTFRSFNAHLPFVRLCVPLLRWLRRVGRDEEAARLVWNHLSVDSPVLAVLFAKHPLLLEDAVTVVCRTMRGGLGMYKEAWMGHRSLALLRVAGRGGYLTPAHCIPTCAAALDCGVHFATVQQFIREVFGSDNDTAKWVLNMVRLTAESHAVRLFVPLRSLSHSSAMRGMLRQYAYEYSVVSSPPLVELCVPSRSKLLALWTMVNDDFISVSLRRLICRLFLDEDALMEFKRMVGKQQTVKSVLTHFFYEEVFASVAANCTTNSSYVIFMNALISQRRMHNTGRCAQLMSSEMDIEFDDLMLPRRTIKEG